MVDGPKYVASIQRARRLKSTKKPNPMKKLQQTTPPPPKMEQLPLPVSSVESNIKFGVSKGDICLFAHFMIGFLGFLNTEWIQIIFEIETSGQEKLLDYLLLADDPAMKSESWNSVYATWPCISSIKIRVQDLRPLVTTEVLVHHCTLLLEHMREKGLKKTCRWKWHVDEGKMLTKFLKCEIEFYVGEENEDGRNLENRYGVRDGIDIEIGTGIEGLSLEDEDTIEGVTTKERPDLDPDTIPADTTNTVKWKENAKTRDSTQGIKTKKLEVIWEEDATPSNFMMALKTVPMVEGGTYCGCHDRCAINKDITHLDLGIDEAILFPIRERMKIRRRNFQSEHSPDRFLLRERKSLGARRS